MPADYTILHFEAQNINFDTTDGTTGCIIPTEATAVLLALYQSLPEHTQEQIHEEMKADLKGAVHKSFVKAMKNFAIQATGYPGATYSRRARGR